MEMLMTTPPEESYLASRAVAMPKDTNPEGDIFGGWLVSQMDLAAGSVATKYAKGRAVTVAIDALTFLFPVFVGDEVSCYVKVDKIGNTSITMRVEAWSNRRMSGEKVKVTEGTFTFVAIDENKRPRQIEK